MKKYLLLLIVPFMMASCGGGSTETSNDDQNMETEQPATDEMTAAPEDETMEEGTDLAQQGRILLEEKGCVACHSFDGTKVIGPSFLGIYGKTQTVITDGEEREVVIDDEFIRRSIKEPDADQLEGYAPGQMVPFANLLNDEEIDAVIEFIKTLKE